MTDWKELIKEKAYVCALCGYTRNIVYKNQGEYGDWMGYHGGCKQKLASEMNGLCGRGRFKPR